MNTWNKHLLALAALCASALTQSEPEQGAELLKIAGEVKHALSSGNWESFRALLVEDAHIYSFTRKYPKSATEDWPLFYGDIPSESLGRAYYAFETETVSWTPRDGASTRFVRAAFETLCDLYGDTVYANRYSLEVSDSVTCQDIPLNGPAMVGKVASNKWWRVGFVLSQGRWRVANVAIGVH